VKSKIQYTATEHLSNRHKRTIELVQKIFFVVPAYHVKKVRYETVKTKTEKTGNSLNKDRVDRKQFRQRRKCELSNFIPCHVYKFIIMGSSALTFVTVIHRP